MAIEYKRRSTKQGRFSEAGVGARAAITQLKNRDDANIAAQERQRQSALRISDQHIKSLGRSYDKPIEQAAKERARLTDIHNNKIRANNIRADREVEALKAQAEQYEKQSKIWMSFNIAAGQALVSKAGDAWKAWEQKQARETYEIPDFTSGFSIATNEAQKDLLKLSLVEIINNKDLSVEDKAAAIKQVTSKSSLIQEDLYAQDYLDNKDVIISSTRRDARSSNGTNLYTEEHVTELLQLRAHLYLRKYDINPHSEAGQRILRATNLWAGVEKRGLNLAARGKNDVQELTLGAQAVRAALKKGDYDLVGSEINAMAVIAMGGVVKVGDRWVEPGQNGHDMTLPEAVEHIIPYLAAANPDMNWDQIDKILANTKVPAVKQYAWNEELALRKERASDAYKHEGGKKLLEAIGKVKKKAHEANLPTWQTVLKGRGYTDILKNKLVNERKQVNQQKLDNAADQADTDIAELTDRFTNKNTKHKDGYLDINSKEAYVVDPNTGLSKRQELYNRASHKNTHPKVRDYIFGELQWDSERNSTFAAEEHYRAARLTGNLDDDVYYYYRMSKAAQEYYANDHQSSNLFFASGGNVEEDIRKPIRIELGQIYQEAFTAGKIPTEVEILEDKGVQTYFHYLHRLNAIKPGEKDYIPNISNRKDKALEMVRLDIEKGNGVFSRKDPKRIGGTLRVEWTGLNSNYSKEKSALNTSNDFTKNFKEYNPRTVYKIISPKQRLELMEMAITGNAEKHDIPENIRSIISRLKVDPTRTSPAHPDGEPLTLRTVINDIITETPDDKTDMEYEWPTGLDDQAANMGAQAYNWGIQDPIKIALFRLYNKQYGRYMRPELANYGRTV